MRFQAFAALTICLLTMACGRQDTIYLDPATGVVSIDEHTVLPELFADQSVNNGVVDVVSSAGTYSVRFRLLGGSSSPGAFNDASGIGSRAILGIGAFDKSLLSNFNFSVSSSSTTGSKLNLSLLVDWTCAASEALHTLESDEIANGTAVAISAHDAIWTVDGSGSKVSIDDLVTAHSAACLRNGVSAAANLPKGQSLAGILLSIGTSSSTDVSSLNLTDLKINGATYSSLSASWGKQ